MNGGREEEVSMVYGDPFRVLVCLSMAVMVSMLVLTLNAALYRMPNVRWRIERTLVHARFQLSRLSSSSFAASSSSSSS